ncbi:MAG TPA: DUF4412 domain-containing protein [Polyangiaceae bacterium]|nr:DUF4412 domain-containing protein [Polyangiaceae bacterium]
MNLESYTSVASLLALAIACKAKPPPGVAHDPKAKDASGSLATLDGFEGEIGLSSKGTLDEIPRPSNPMNVKALVKGGRLRVPLPDLLGVTAYLGMAYLIVVPEKKELYAVSDNKLEAIVIGLDELVAHSRRQNRTKPGPSTNGAKPFEAYHSGQTDQVAGYACERWNVEFGLDKMELCVAKLPTPWLRVSLGALASEYPWAAELTDGNHLPLRLIMRLAGAEQGRLEITHIEKKGVQASSVQVPPKYAVSTFAQLLRSFTIHTAPNPTSH